MNGEYNASPVPGPVSIAKKNARPGGLLRYGIPDFKLEKSVLDRRLKLMEKEGIVLITGTHVGIDRDGVTLGSDFDALVLCCVAARPRNLPIPGCELPRG